MRVSLALFSLFLSVACGSSDDRTQPVTDGVPRVILISCDTLRADRLGAYGNPRVVSPKLDEFARDCVIFDEAYACAPMTQPAVSALLAGKLPIEIGAAPGNLRLMSAEVDTLAERLRAAGYETAGIVANWILRRPEDRSAGVGVAQGFDYFDDEMPGQGKRRVPEKRGAETTDAALAWLDQRLSDQFFLWVHYQDPHGPYMPPPLFQRLFESPRGVEEPVPLGESKLGHGQIPGYQRVGWNTDPSIYRDLYDAEIRYFDREVGRLLEHLDSAGLLDDALVVFTSDHGEALGEHDFWFCHGESVYREIVRVPFFVRWPGGRVPDTFGATDAAGYRRCAPLASHLDVVPTVLDAVGLDPTGLRGVSVLAGPPPLDRILPQNLWPSEGRPRWWSASDGHYRLVWSELDPEPRLYDVLADPYETRDLASGFPEVVARMSAAHENVLTSAVAPLVEGREIELDDEALRALESLGYAGVGDDEDE